MEIQGQILTIRHMPAIAEENKRLKAEITGLNWLIANLKGEIVALKKEKSSLNSAFMMKGKEEKAAKERRIHRGKLQTRKGWKPPE